MARRRTETWLAAIAVVVGLVIVAGLGFWGYMAATPPLHPDPAAVPSSTAAAPSPQWADAVERGRQIVRAALAEHSLPGLSVAVGAGGGITWAEGFGWIDVDTRMPVTPDTRFRIGTASVALTSAAIGLLLEQGRLNLDDEIQRYVPEFPEKQWPVTLGQLMGHTAGVANDSGDEGPLFAERCARPADALPFLTGDERELRFEPGTQFAYSSYGWILLSAAVEAAAGEPFLAFMRTQIFEPLGMRNTMADAGAEPRPDFATPYFPRFAADPRYGLHSMRPLDYSCYAGASVFVSTPSDLVRFGLAINSGTLLQPATVNMLQTTQRLPTGEETGYGLGWDLETVEVAGTPARAAGHDGDALGGMVSSFITLPAHRIVVAVTSNISYADTHAVAVRIAQAFAERSQTQ